MVTIEQLRTIAFSFPGTTEEPHFEKTSFRINKKIFASFDDATKRACIKLSEIDQDVFCKIDSTIIYPVPGKWGKNGWTYIQMNSITKDLLIDALKMAYCQVAPVKFSSQVRTEKIKKGTAY